MTQLKLSITREGRPEPSRIGHPMLCIMVINEYRILGWNGEYWTDPITGQIWRVIDVKYWAEISDKE